MEVAGDLRTGLRGHGWGTDGIHYTPSIWKREQSVGSVFTQSQGGAIMGEKIRGCGKWV